MVRLSGRDARLRPDFRMRSNALIRNSGYLQWNASHTLDAAVAGFALIEDEHAERRGDRLRNPVRQHLRRGLTHVRASVLAPVGRECVGAEGVVFGDREQLMLRPEVVMSELARHLLGGVEQLV